MNSGRSACTWLFLGEMHGVAIKAALWQIAGDVELITVLPSNVFSFLSREGAFAERPDIGLILVEIMPGAPPPRRLTKICEGCIPVVALYSEGSPRSAVRAYRRYADFCAYFTAAGGILRAMRAVYAYWLSTRSRSVIGKTQFGRVKAA